jgi:hypothetical protein
MKSRSYRTIMGALALLSLAACLALGVMAFLGRLPDAGYKKGFLAASVLWFVFSIARGKRAPGPSAGGGGAAGAGVV